MSTNHYDEALERLILNKPKILMKGQFSINNDSVAKEAGRKPGSIKAIRKPELVKKIKKAEKERKSNKNSFNNSLSSLDKTKKNLKELKIKYQDALNREMLLMIELDKKEKELLRYKSQVVTLRP